VGGKTRMNDPAQHNQSAAPAYLALALDEVAGGREAWAKGVLAIVYKPNA
jgi:hypothetical protein